MIPYFLITGLCRVLRARCVSGDSSIIVSREYSFAWEYKSELCGVAVLVGAYLISAYVSQSAGTPLSLM